ncbi:excisionase family DNA-binding protein [Halalkalibacter urbisdiaboli]|uniref:excisionase family DNA-binding protein n=1 Tax=Halalkalibacter urbisdiaboli TaxID=1960589 RepID=UPI000B42E0ED|nr:excisionase family DNA-binding protein [Halalkalibacter urbisdiaboli]
MYVSIQELATYLGVTEDYIVEQIQLGHIKAVFDGKQFLLNKEQFSWHKEQLDIKRKQLLMELEEPLPEDWDAKDED